MSKHFHRDMENLQHDILSLSGLVEDMISKAARSLSERDVEVAAEVIRSDAAVDEHEVRLEEECLKMLALHQPVASDLRRVATVVKINNDLERIADLAVNIAERAQCLWEHADFVIPEKLRSSAKTATRMVRDSLNAFVNFSVEQARQVCQRDDEVDGANRDTIAELQEVMKLRSDWVAPALHCMSAAKYVERIADLATNIAEDVIYLVEGDIVRHHSKRLSLGSMEKTAP